MHLKVAVLGGYGLIGSACIQALKCAEFQVVGIGRSAEKARQCDGEIEWVIRDISTTSADEWKSILTGFDVVVNAAGALQDGAQDRVSAIHETAVKNICDALVGCRVRVVQISAAGVSEDASTEFFRSKARGDKILRNSGLDHVILRPTLVISPKAYGGTALLRAAAAMPVCGLHVSPDASMQTVSVADVAGAVVQAARGDIATGTQADLSEAGARTLGEVTRELRAWQGFAPWRFEITLPRVLVKVVGWGADLAGWLGWRSPLRSTALRVLEDGVAGQVEAWQDAGGQPFRALEETLAAMPAGVQERWFARLYLMLPMAVVCLALFWLSSGIIGFWQRAAAAEILTARGMAGWSGQTLVLLGCVADIAVGLGVLWRPTARVACYGMVLISLGYITGSVFWAGDLWADPLGPMVKVIPGIMLALMTGGLLEDR